MEKYFPNGFVSWAETHHQTVEIVTIMLMNSSKTPQLLLEHQHELGYTGIMDLCIEMTDNFEMENKDRFWDGEWIEEVEKFVLKTLGVAG